MVQGCILHGHGLPHLPAADRPCPPAQKERNGSATPASARGQKLGRGDEDATCEELGDQSPVADPKAETPSGF